MNCEGERRVLENFRQSLIYVVIITTTTSITSKKQTNKKEIGVIGRSTNLFTNFVLLLETGPRHVGT